MFRKKSRKEPAVIKKPGAQANELADSVIDTVREPFIALDQDLKVVKVNRSFYETFKLKPEETLGQHIYELGNKQLDIPRLRELLESIIPQTSTYDGYDIEYDFPDIGRRTLLLNVRQIPGLLGKDNVTLLAIEDITERKQAQEALYKEKTFERSLIETAQAIVLVLDTSGYIVTFNPYMEQLSGYLLEEVKGKDWFSTFLPRDQQAEIRDLFLRALGDVQTKGNVNEIVTKDGRARSIEWYDKTLKDANGVIVGLLSIGQDITERKFTDKKLQQSEERYRTLFESANDGILIASSETRKFRYANPAFCKMLGFGQDELIGLGIEDIHPQDALDNIIHVFEAQAKGEKKLASDIPCQKKDGTIIYADIHSATASIDGEECAIGFFIDITERKKVEESVRESERKFKNIIEHISDIFYMLNTDYEMLYISPQAEKVLGHTVEEVRNNWQGYVTDNPINLAAHEKTQLAMTTGEKQEPYLQEFIDRNGTKRLIEINESPLKNDKGEVIGMVGAARDITESMKINELLWSSEAQYRLLSEHTTDTVWLMDMNLNLTYFSPSVEKLRGFTARELMEMPLEQHVTAKSFELVAEVISQEIPRVEADAKYNPILTLNLEYNCKDGTTVWTENRLSVIRDENGNLMSILGESRDVTERRLSEEKLLKSYESVKKTLDDAINTMVKIVELRDPYTAGHQQRVADLATAIAREMKWEDTRIDQLKTVAVIHDIGKMYVPSDILSKPGKLSDIEFSLIKTHSQRSYDIVKGMDFPGVVAEAILQHHERLDGSGYPRGLRGEDTLPEAKILAVADVVEAMSAHRHYRPALGIDKALEEISKNKGKLYDPAVADICLELFSSGRFEFKPV